MTAEEYIESVGNTVVNGKAIVKSDFIPKNIAYKAVKMARKEEREKFCGECDKFLYEDTDGFGYCNVTRREKRCDDKCNLNTKNSYGKDNK